jgi:putative acetyltransferase
MNIRPFKGEDFDAIDQIYTRSKLDELRYEKTSFELLPLLKDRPRLDALLASQIFVYDDGIIQGYGAVFESEIRAIFVHPDYRGKGVGKRLLEKVISLAGHGATLYVAKSNAAAISLYRNYGFEIAREFEATYNGQAVLANEMARRSEAYQSKAFKDKASNG